jgi:chromatin remodeling complex protein RSC6
MTTETSQQIRAGKRLSKKTKPVVETPVEPVVETPVEPVVETPVEPVVETPVEPAISEDEPSVEEQINTLRSLINDNVKQIKENLAIFKTIDHELKKLSVTAKKFMKKKEKKLNSRKNVNNGFNALVKISDELADFLNLPHGSEIRPPQVSSLISKYANENNLKDQSNKAIYLCDAKMLKLLGPAKYPVKKSDPSLGMGVSIFNLNSYLKQHFIKI